MAAARRSAKPSPLPSGSGLRERNKREKLARILAAARELFEEKGFDATTTRAIAQRAGVGVGTVFLYVEDKDELLFRVFREEIGPVASEAFDTLDREAPVVDQLLHVFGRMIDHYTTHADLSRVFLQQLLFQATAERPDVMGFTMGFLQGIGGILEAGQERGELRPDLPALIAAGNLFSTYYLALLGALTEFAPDREVHRALLREALELQIRGLETRT